MSWVEVCGVLALVAIIAMCALSFVGPR